MTRPKSALTQANRAPVELHLKLGRGRTLITGPQEHALHSRDSAFERETRFDWHLKARAKRTDENLSMFWFFCCFVKRQHNFSHRRASVTGRDGRRCFQMWADRENKQEQRVLAGGNNAEAGWCFFFKGSQFKSLNVVICASRLEIRDSKSICNRSAYNLLSGSSIRVHRGPGLLRHKNYAWYLSTVDIPNTWELRARCVCY